ncbi:hypothetical protein ABAC460_04650 [Asticcacaulis sp. AC460]|uniref:hypothetical protein n=1 Tax=Asticcacaulis sp. AC460 TaxID=1282360 RepID=UPI0003C3B4C2|nr:hypothetical protein [Asticcacaulis sp. AC460]ESQ92182.1 hypothetical protein ABAC460_04650 [Asticcacaulis sp. AC460]
MVRSTFFSRFQEWLSEWDETKTRQSLIVVLAVLIGLLVGLIIYTGINYFFLGPLTDMRDKEQLVAIYKTMTLADFIPDVVAWVSGTLAGGYTAVRIAKLGQFPAWIVGVLLFAFYAVGMVGLPNPIWFVLLCPASVAACAYGAGWLGMYITVQREIKAQA